MIISLVYDFDYHKFIVINDPATDKDRLPYIVYVVYYGSGFNQTLLIFSIYGYLVIFYISDWLLLPQT